MTARRAAPGLAGEVGMLSESKKKMLEQYNEGLKLYKARRFQDALRRFEKALEHEPEDGPSKEYVKRCVEYMKNPPPADWDGVKVMERK